MSAAHVSFGLRVVPTLAVEWQIARLKKASNKLRIMRNFPEDKNKNWHCLLFARQPDFSLVILSVSISETSKM